MGGNRKKATTNVMLYVRVLRFTFSSLMAGVCNHHMPRNGDRFYSNTNSTAVL